MTIKVTYNVTDVYMSQSVSPVYINISYSDGGASGGGVWGSITGTLSNQTDLQSALDLKLDESTIDGGTEGQILSKASGTDFDFAWINNYAKYLATNVRNQTGSTIGAFQVVYISGATGNKPLISLADADTEATSSKTYGVTATSIANNGTGDVVTAGELSGIDTSAFNEGDLLWLSTTAGGVVTSPPAEPAHAVFIGYVVRSHPTLGVIDVAIANGYELNELHGVQITTPTDNQGLFYNSTSTLWENKSITTALGYTPVPTTRNITINGVTYDLSADRTYTISTGISGSGAAGQVTFWDSATNLTGSNNLFWDNANGRLGIGTNVPARQLVIYDAVSGVPHVQWANASTGVTNTDGFQIRLLSTNQVHFTNFENSAMYFGNQGISGQMTFYPSGNLAVGTSASDSGQRLQVYGSTLLKGAGNTGGTIALNVQNSDSNTVFGAFDNGILVCSTNSQRGLIYSGDALASANIGIVAITNQSNIVISNSRTVSQGLTNGSLFVTRDGVETSSTGNPTTLFIVGHKAADSFAPTSGSIAFTTAALSPRINQVGSTGITRGLYINPTLTAAADWRSIEWSNNSGWGLYGAGTALNYINSKLLIGYAVDQSVSSVSSALQISGTTNESTTAHILRNSNDAVGAVMRLAKTRSASNGGFTVVQDGDRIGSIAFAYADGSAFRPASALIGAEVDGTSISNVNSPGRLVFYTTPSGSTTSSERMRLNNAGNLIINSIADNGQRLQVIGDTLLRGSGNTSATTALTVQNSSSTNLFTVRNDGFVNITNTLASSLSVNSSNFTTRILINNTNANPNAGFELQTNGVTNWALANYKPIGSTNASFVFYNQRTSTDSFFIDGDTNNVGINTNAPTARLDIPASVTTAASIRIRSGTAPTTPNDGDIWFDGTDIKMRIGGVTKTFTLV